MPKVQIDYILSQKVASEDVSHVSSTHGGMSDHLPLSVDVETASN
jgi:endonuclease/exonuclease/phosphatase family metal-dependent hydrolase